MDLQQDIQHVNNGQCGLCVHFGETQRNQPQIIQIRKKHEAPVTFTAECGHPNNLPLHLVVTPVSGCQGFEPAPEALGSPQA